MHPQSPSDEHLQPLEYHRAISDLLQVEEPGNWKSFQDCRIGGAHAKLVRLELLKSSSPLDRNSEPKLYEAANIAAAKLEFDLPITLNRAQNSATTAASCVYISGEAQIVIHGPLETKLSPQECVAAIARELSRHRLLDQDDGRIQTVDQILTAKGLDEETAPAYLESERLFRLYTEIFCDRSALLATADLHVVIGMLLKVETDTGDVDPNTYLAQADEVLNRSPQASDSSSLPELFIRAKALKLWHQRDPEIQEMLEKWIEGPLNLMRLDLIGQQRLTRYTRELMSWFMENESIQSSELVSTTLRTFLPATLADSNPAVRPELVGALSSAESNVKEYICFVLLDLVTADRDLEELPLAAALVIAETLGIKSELLEISHRELRLRKRQLKKIDDQKLQLLKL